MTPLWDVVIDAAEASHLKGVSKTDGSDTRIDSQEERRREMTKGSGSDTNYIKSQMSYLEPWDTSWGDPFYRSAPDEGFGSTNFKWMDFPVVITDARPWRDSHNIDEHAFAIYDDLEPISDTLLDSLRSNDKDTVK